MKFVYTVIKFYRRISPLPSRFNKIKEKNKNKNWYTINSPMNHSYEESIEMLLNKEIYLCSNFKSKTLKIVLPT